MTLGNDNGTDGRTDRRTDRQTDGQTEFDAICAPPTEEGRIIRRKTCWRRLIWPITRPGYVICMYSPTTLVAAEVSFYKIVCRKTSTSMRFFLSTNIITVVHIMGVHIYLCIGLIFLHRCDECIKCKQNKQKYLKRYVGLVFRSSVRTQSSTTATGYAVSVVSRSERVALKTCTSYRP